MSKTEAPSVLSWKNDGAVSDLRWRIRHIGQQKSKSMKKSLFFLLISSLLMLNAKCGRDDCEFVQGGNKFNVFVPVTYSPMQEKYKVGDTLLVEIQVPAMMEDTLTGEQLPMGDLVFEGVGGGDFGGLIFRYIKTQLDSTQWVLAAHEFDYVPQIGTVKITSGLPTLALTFFKAADEHRTTQFLLVPRRTGTYTLAFDTPSLVVTHQIGNYCYALLNLCFGGRIAHNYHLLKDFDVNKIGTYEQKKGTFSFIVEE